MTRKGFPPRPARLLATLTPFLMFAVCGELAAAQPETANFDALLQRELQSQREREFQLKPKFQPGVVTDATAPLTGADTGVCLPLQRIELHGASVLDVAARASFTSLPTAGCLSVADIRRRIDAINTWYLRRGFVTSRAQLPPQDVSSGVLRIEVIEGRIESLISESPELSQRLLRQVFPQRKGQLLNLRDLEQGLENLNRLQSTTTTIDLVPGEETGRSRVIVDQDIASPWSTRFGIDNGGQVHTGRYQANALVARDNPVGLAGFLYGYAQTDIGVRGSESRSQTWQLHYDVPLGYTRLAVDISRFRYGAQVKGLSTPVINHGRVHQYQLGLQRVVVRNAVSIARLGAEWRRRDTENRIGDVRLKSSSFAYSVASAHVEYERYLTRAHIAVQAGVDRGVGGEKRFVGDTRHQFRKYRLELRASGDLQAWPGVYWRQQIFWQQAAQPLYSAEQVAIGGQYSVRGFHSTSLSGSRGGWWRQSISLPTGAPDKPWWPDRISLGIDVGRVKTGDGGWRSLRGIGVECRYQWRELSVKIGYSHPINPPSPLAEDGEVFSFAVLYTPG